MTSNVGFNNPIVSGNINEAEQIKLIVSKEVKKIFRPELLKGVDEFIMFHKLSIKQMKEIANAMLKEVSDRMMKLKNIKIPSFKEKLVAEGYSPRPLRRAIVRLLEDNLAGLMLKGDVKEGDSVMVDIDSI